MRKFFLYYSGISSLLYISASVVFFSVFGNVQGGLWASAAAIISAKCFVMHCLHFSMKLEMFFEEKQLKKLITASFIIVLISSACLIWYIFTAVYWKIPFFEYDKTPLFSIVFSFITGKWGLHMYTAAKEYSEQLNTIKALGIKKKFELYATEKEFAKAGKHSDISNQSSLGTKLSESFNSICNSPRRTKPGFFNKFRVEDSVENFIMKSMLGFLGGILLTYICFMFLVFSLNFTLKRATYICMGLGVILSLGLAFSVKIRCTVFLCIPQLFSKRGRQALLAYAFILALSGPAKNTLHNVEVMSESLACTQEQLKQAENELLKCVQKPNAAAKKSIEKLLEKINSAVKHFKNFILQLYKNCFDTLETVLQAQKWLYSITFLCHKKMGHPAHACLNLLTEASDNCEAVMPDLSWKNLCRISPSAKKMICYTEEKTVCPNARCVLGNLPVLQLKEHLNTFKRRAMNILHVRIEAHQTYSQANRSHTYHEEYQGMATEIRQKTDQFLQYFDFMSVIFGIFILVLFVKVVIYRHKFLTEDHYDNRYITSDFVDIDNTRAAFHMETILPLEPREKMQYIKVTSVRLVPCERVRLLSSFVFLIFATFKIIIHMLTDSSLYWILSSVRREERLLYMSTIKEEYPVVAVKVNGEGLVASLFQNVTRAVRKESSFIRMDPTPCLPDPVPPDWNRYYQILALVIICWLLALWEPYGLRLRHTVMVTYHPDRARERAIWLYNRIISNRISFVKMSRRQLRRKYKDVSPNDTFRYKFFGRSTPRCLLCGETADCVTCVQCVTPKCVGIYCASCFSILKFCSICRNPAEYSDLSDISEERDSSDEERPSLENLRKEDTWERKESKVIGPQKAIVSSSLTQGTDFSFSEELKALTNFESFESEKQPSLVVQEFNSTLKDKIPDKCLAESVELVGETNKMEQQTEVELNDLELDGPSASRSSDEDRPKPDFIFKQIYPRKSSSLVTLRDRNDFSKLPPKYSRMTFGNRNKCDVGVLARLRTTKAETEMSKRDTKSTMSPTVSISRLDVNSSEVMSLKLPFIDPINLDEYLVEPERPEPDPAAHPEAHLETQAEKRAETSSRGSRPSTSRTTDKKRRKRKVDHKPRSSLFERTSNRSERKSSSLFVINDSQNNSESIELWCTEDTSSSLSGNDGQFYSQSYRSMNSYSKRRSRIIAPPDSFDISTETDKIILPYSSDLGSSRGRFLPEQDLSTVEKRGRVYQEPEDTSLPPQRSNSFEENLLYIYGIIEPQVGPSEEDFRNLHAGSEKFPDEEGTRATDDGEFDCECEHDEEELKNMVLGCRCQIFKRLD